MRCNYILSILLTIFLMSGKWSQNISACVVNVKKDGTYQVDSNGSIGFITDHDQDYIEEQLTNTTDEESYSFECKAALQGAICRELTDEEMDNCRKHQGHAYCDTRDVILENSVSSSINFIQLTDDAIIIIDEDGVHVI